MVTSKVTSDGRKELRIGLLGCGFMGKCHTNAYHKIPYIYPAAGVKPRLLILCDQQRQLVAREALRYGFEEYSADWHDVVADPRVDVFDNCGPDPVHVEPCIAALEQGKHVICEKPLAVSAAAARRMRDAAARLRRQVDVHVQLPLHAAVRFAKDLIADGQLGDDLPRADPVPADGRARSGAAAGQGLGLDLAALRLAAGHRQPRHRPVPVPGGRDQERVGPGAGVQPGAGPAQRRAAIPA